MTATIVHELRCWVEYFEAVWDGRKTFEVRYDDRGFQTGDSVALREWDQKGECACDRYHGRTCGRYTGREIVATISYMLASSPGPRNGFNGNGYVVLALTDLERGLPATASAGMRAVAVATVAP